MDADVVYRVSRDSSGTDPGVNTREMMTESLRRRFTIRAWAWVVFVCSLGGFAGVLALLSLDSDVPVWTPVLTATAVGAGLYVLLRRIVVDVDISSATPPVLIWRTALDREPTTDRIVGASFKWSMAYVIPILEKTLFVRVRKEDGTTTEVPVAAAISRARRQELRELHERLSHLSAAVGDTR